jgi:hypothetical protein
MKLKEKTTYEKEKKSESPVKPGIRVMKLEEKRLMSFSYS